MRLLRHSVHFFCLGFCAAALAQSPTPSTPPTDPAAVSLITSRDPIATIRGKWRFQPGDDPRYADPGFDDSHWPLLNANQSWADQGYKGLSGYAWYRFHIVLPAGSTPYKLELAPILTGYQVFLDGKLVQTVGPMQGRWLFTTARVGVPLPTTPRSGVTTIPVAIRVWHSPIWAGYVGGGPAASGKVGTAAEIDNHIQFFRYAVKWNNTVLVVLSLFALISGVASSVLFLLRRSAREYLWFAIFCFAYLVPPLIAYFTAQKIVNIELIEGISNFFGDIFYISVILLLRQIFNQKFNWLYRIALAAMLLDIISTVALHTFQDLSIATQNSIGTVLASIVSICLLIIIFRKTRQKDNDAAFLLASFFLYEFVHLTQSVIWTAQTFGHPLRISLSQFIDNPFPITLGNVADLVLFLGLLAVLLNRFARTSRVQDRIAADLESARTLQQVLIPETLPTIPGIIIATAYHPAQEVGGDFFQIIPIADGDTLIVLGDVSGKGLPAAMTVSLIVGALRTIVEFTSSPAEILASLNRRLHNRGSGFTTCVALRISPSGLLTIANAGHLAPYLNGEELECDAALPLGLDLDLALSERTHQTAPSDHLTLITDGVLEATNHEGKLFGFDRTLNSSVHAAGHIAGLARDFGQSDDITVLTLDFA